MTSETSVERKSTWQEHLLGDVVEKFIDYRGKTPKKTTTGVPLITAKVVKNGKILPATEFIAAADYGSWMTRGLPQVDDVVLTTEAPLGEVALIKDTNIALAQRIITIRAKKDRAFGPFLKFLLQSEAGQYALQSRASGTTVSGIKASVLKCLPVEIPSVSEQKAIAAILTCVDNKIDLLHRQNQTLEAMAETLFRQWFLEEPAPTSVERPLSNIATFLNGLACQKYPPANDVDKLPVLKIRELSSGINEASDWASSQVKPEFIVEAGDVIFAWSASLMVKVWDGERCVLNQHLFKVTSDEFPKWFYLRWCKHHLAEFIAISASHATTMGHIKRGDLDAAMVLVPTPEELQAMTRQMAPLLEKQIEIARQRRTLESLRDSLLPKLMSGEVRVAY